MNSLDSNLPEASSVPERSNWLRGHLFVLGSTALLFAVPVLSTGCRSVPVREKINAAGQSSFDRGMIFINERKWNAALKEFDHALQAGSIDADQAGKLYAYQALAYAQVGKPDEAAKALEYARSGPDLDLVDRIDQQIRKLKQGQ